MFYYVKKPQYGRRNPCYDIYRDNRPFLILAPDERLHHREAREIASVLNRYLGDVDYGRGSPQQRRSDDNKNGPPPR
jgi:hypothetical protein